MSEWIDKIDELLRCKKYDEALKLAQEELHTSEEKLVYNTLGVIYVLKGEEDKAIEFL